ncbi:MAG: diadenylate cyclase CdaA [Bacteroidales bacterium]|nr:diadenylate cyclase CdaA [Bacteroidales bacterium]
MTLLSVLQFLKFGIADLVDILLVALLLLEFYRLLKGTAAMRIVWTIVVIFIFWKITTLLHLTMLSEIIGQIISVGVIALIIVFQPEIRQFLLFLGNTKLVKWVAGRFQKKDNADAYKDDIHSVCRACRRMSNSKTGALIVFAKENPLEEFISSGEKLDAMISRDLIENIFFKNAPLHDGALIIKNHRIVAARCILPVSHKEDLPTDLGLRHRSALGATTLTDAIVVVVSEQTGQIAFCKAGEIQRDLSPLVLEQTLRDEFRNM